MKNFKNNEKGISLMTLVIIIVIVIIIGLLFVKTNNKKEEKKFATNLAATTLNHKYTTYEGDNKNKNEIDSLLSNIFENNQRASSYKVECILLGEKITNYNSSNLKLEQDKLTPNYTYNVSFEYDKDGIINKIIIVSN